MITTVIILALLTALVAFDEYANATVPPAGGNPSP
jgi:hypothetical protein